MLAQIDPQLLQEPAERARLSLPMEVRLTTTAEVVAEQATHPGRALFAAYINQEPRPVGRTLARPQFGYFSVCRPNAPNRRSRDSQI